VHTLPNLIRFGRETCGDLAQAERREYWLANGLGGYAAGTIAGTLTRRYHGLLIAPVNPPLGRHLVFSKADAWLIDGDTRWPLFTNRWGSGVIEPRGYLHLESFELQGRMPVWRFAFGDLRIEQRIWMEAGANTTYVAWRLDESAGALERPPELRVKLLINARDHHGVTWSAAFNPELEAGGSELRVRHGDWFSLYLKARGGDIVGERTWYDNFDLAVERERGLGDRDAHLCVGEARLTLHPGEWVGVVGSLHEDASTYLSEAMRRFVLHDEGQLRRAKVQVTEFLNSPAWIDQLMLAADSFVFARPTPNLPEGESVIAGFPWFGDWGRDTMIALPGLTLATGRYDTARRVLQTFARFVDRGMLPNVFPGVGETPEYNTADAALWYIEAWRAYFAATNDKSALRGAFPVLQDIIGWHERGTRYGIGMDPHDALLRAGEPGVQVTWMDAKVGDWVVTPRIGKPVEINALWYNALNCMAQLAQVLGQASEHFAMLAERVRVSFVRFIDHASGGLYDVIDGPSGADATLRPNQIFAVSLPHSPLDASTQLAVVSLCGRLLLTSYGLRSLDPRLPEFRPQYLGGVWERDGSYHQGPVWAWLLGHYALAEFRVTRDARAAQARLEPLMDHLMDAGLGTVSEIFDGAAPHMPRGAPAQAWSVACALEAWWLLERAKRAAKQDSAVKDVPHKAAVA
jgi:predicted glycogen debranching enzyme